MPLFNPRAPKTDLSGFDKLAEAIHEIVQDRATRKAIEESDDPDVKELAKLGLPSRDLIYLLVQSKLFKSKTAAEEEQFKTHQKLIGERQKDVATMKAGLPSAKTHMSQAEKDARALAVGEALGKGKLGAKGRAAAQALGEKGVVTEYLKRQKGPKPPGRGEQTDAATLQSLPSLLESQPSPEAKHAAVSVRALLAGQADPNAVADELDRFVATDPYASAGMSAVPKGAGVLVRRIYGKKETPARGGGHASAVPAAPTGMTQEMGSAGQAAGPPGVRDQILKFKTAGKSYSDVATALSDPAITDRYFPGHDPNEIQSIAKDVYGQGGSTLADTLENTGRAGAQLTPTGFLSSIYQRLIANPIERAAVGPGPYPATSASPFQHSPSPMMSDDQMQLASRFGDMISRWLVPGGGYNPQPSVNQTPDVFGAPAGPMTEEEAHRQQVMEMLLHGRLNDRMRMQQILQGDTGIPPR